MENININSEDLDEDNLDVLVNKIEFIKRIYKIEKSTLSVEKIWFIVQNSKLLNSKDEKQLRIVIIFRLLFLQNMTF